jgi:hypothetical protein
MAESLRGGSTDKRLWVVEKSLEERWNTKVGQPWPGFEAAT